MDYSSPKIQNIFYSLAKVVKSSWQSLENVKVFVKLSATYYLCLKKDMEKGQLQTILDNANDEFLDSLFETILNEINADDEPYYKKARQLLLASLNKTCQGPVPCHPACHPTNLF